MKKISHPTIPANDEFLEVPRPMRDRPPDHTIPPVNDDTLEITRSVRDVPPAHYTFKIESFSLLSQILVKSEVHKYETGDFEAGGYKWRLLLYPNGNKKINVDDHISLYLAMSDSNDLPIGWEVNVTVKFTVYDQIRDKYLSLQDGRVWRFHAPKTERGIPRLLSLSTLNDTSNGYLVDDCCVFGVEVFVIKCEGKVESLSIINELKDGTLTWKIDKFSEMKKKDYLFSEVFNVGGRQRMLCVPETEEDRLTKKGKEHPLPNNDDNLEFATSVRDVPPAHYILKIESFLLLSQLLQKSGDDKYESNDFEAGGYKWKLLLYPEGNKKKGVDGYISLYLAMSDTKNIALRFEVNVIFKFFVYDQIRDKYLTIEDGKVRRFHALRTESGIARLLSLSTFNDPSNGYLFDDSCMFGAEVYVIKCEAKGEKLTMINEPATATLTWKIEKFSLLNVEFLDSELFDAGGCKWKLQFYPSGYSSKAKGKKLSLYLCIQDFSVLRLGWKSYVECKLIIKDQVLDKNYEKTINRWFCSSSTNWGFPELIALNDLKDQKKGFIVNDTMILEAKITFISVVNCFA